MNDVISVRRGRWLNHLLCIGSRAVDGIYTLQLIQLTITCCHRLPEWIDKDMSRRAHCISDPSVKTRAKRKRSSIS